MRKVAADRIQAGIDLLGDPTCLEAFRHREQDAWRKRRADALGSCRVSDRKMSIRPGDRFQLAFHSDEPQGIAEPGNADREIVDLLFFPTGGGKTEAYLGLAAFTLVLRRLRNPGIRSARVERADALHAAAADAGSTRPRRDADLRSGIGAAERCGQVWRLAVRDRACGSGAPPRRTGWAAKGTTIRIGARPHDPLSE